MNKKIYVGTYLASLGLLVLPVFSAVAFGRIAAGALVGLGFEPYDAEQMDIRLLLFAALQFLAVHVLYQFVILAKMWGAIDDGQARATPLSAILLLFVPFFNIYWIFQVWNGFRDDYGHYTHRHGMPAANVSSSAFLLYPLFALLAGIPYVGLLFAIANVFVFVRIIAAVCDAVNALGAARSVEPAGRRGAQIRDDLLLNI